MSIDIEEIPYEYRDAGKNGKKKLVEEILNNDLFKGFMSVSDISNEKNKAYLATILELTSAITDYQKSGQRQNLFPEYSKHEIEHSYMVMRYMHQLLENKEQVNSATYFYLIMVALCHDLGMTILNNDDIEKIKGNAYWATQKQKYNWDRVKKSVKGNEHAALSIIVRNSHHEKEIVEQKVKFLFKKNGYNYSQLETVEWDLIYKGCYSHGISIDEIKNIINGFSQEINNGILRKFENGKFEGVNFALVCSLLRICDLLDISYKRVGQYNMEENTNPYNLMNKFVKEVVIEEDTRLPGYACISGNAGSFKCQRIEKYIKIVFEENELKQIDDPASTIDSRNLYETAYIYLLQYFKQIEDELKNLKELLDFETVTGSNTEYIRPHIHELKCVTEKYKYLKISIDEDTVLKELMSDRLYGSSEMAIRELLQNAFDACQAKSIIDEDYVPKIRISYQNNVFSIRDNGTGMNLNVIENYFLKAGKSLYKSNAYKYSNSQFFHAGQFGIGVFATFMLTSQLKVTTVSVENHNKEYVFTMKKGCGYAKIDSREPAEFTNGHSGTKIEFKINDNVNIPDLENLIQRTFLSPDNINLKIYLNGKETKLFTLPNIELMQHFIHRFEYGISEKINLADYLKDVNGYVFLEKCPTRFMWYDAVANKFVADCIFNSGMGVAVIEVFDQTPKSNDNKLVRFFIPWECYFANTNHNLQAVETLSSLENLMGQDFNELCKGAGIDGYKLVIKRYRTIFSDIDHVMGNEISGNGCDTTKNKLIYVNNILITGRGDDFQIPLPMNLPYRVRCLAMNIINYDSDENTEIGLTLNRNDFTSDTYNVIRTAVQYAIFKYLSGSTGESNLSDIISELVYKDNFLIKMEN